MQTIQSDLALLDVPLPDGLDAEPFYTTLLHTWLRALMVTFNLDESELDGFLAPWLEEKRPLQASPLRDNCGGKRRVGLSGGARPIAHGRGAVARAASRG